MTLANILALPVANEQRLLFAEDTGQFYVIAAGSPGAAAALAAGGKIHEFYTDEIKRLATGLVPGTVVVLADSNRAEVFSPTVQSQNVVVEGEYPTRILRPVAYVAFPDVDWRYNYKFVGTDEMALSYDDINGHWTYKDTTAAPGAEQFPWDADWSGTGLTFTRASLESVPGNWKAVDGFEERWRTIIRSYRPKGSIFGGENISYLPVDPQPYLPVMELIAYPVTGGYRLTLPTMDYPETFSAGYICAQLQDGTIISSDTALVEVLDTADYPERRPHYLAIWFSDTPGGPPKFATYKLWHIYGESWSDTNVIAMDVAAMDCFSGIMLYNYGVGALKAVLGVENTNVASSDLYPSSSGGALHLPFGDMDAESLNYLFAKLPPGADGAGIYVAGHPGSKTCDPAIATAKGYTVATAFA